MKAVSISSTAQTDAFYMTAFVAPLVQDISDDTLLAAETIAQLDRLMHIATVDNDVEMARIWRRDGTILYSTDKATIGTRMDLSGAETAFRGEVVGHVEEVSDDVSAHLGRKGMALFEVYAPLHSLETGAIVAVGEFYKNAQPLLDQISSADITIWSTTAVVSAMMMGMLYLLARRSNRTIVEQRDRLKRRAAKASALARQNETLRGRSDLAKLQAIKANEDLLTDIGSTLYDGPIQSLALLVLKLSAVGTDRRRIVEDCAEAAGLASGVVHDLRDMATGLVLPELEELDVEQVVRLAVERHETLTGTGARAGYRPAARPAAARLQDLHLPRHPGKPQQRLPACGRRRPAGFGGVERRRGDLHRHPQRPGARRASCPAADTAGPGPRRHGAAPQAARARRQPCGRHGARRRNGSDCDAAGRSADGGVSSCASRAKRRSRD